MTYASAEERWAAAAQLAEGAADEHMSVRRRKVFLGLGFIAGVTWLLTATIAIVAAFRRNDEAPASNGAGDLAEWQLIPMAVLIITGIVIGVVGLFWAVRTKRFIARWRAVVGPLNAIEAKGVRRQFAGKAPVDGEHLPTIIAIARQQRRAAWGIAPLLVAIAFWVVGLLIGQIGDFSWLSTAGLVVTAVGYVIGVIQMVVAYHNTGRFIEKYADDQPRPLTAA